MAVAFYDLGSAAGLKKLDESLLTRSYITGYQASKDDITVYVALSGAPSSCYVNISRWYNHIDALLRISGVSGEGCGVTVEGCAPAEAVATPPAEDSKAAAAEEDDDDDDVDLFGEETEEEKKAAEERAAALKASSKKKESGKSSVLLDVKPWDDETDYPCLYVFVEIKINVDGLINTIEHNLTSSKESVVLAGTIQFSSAIRSAKPELEKRGFRVLIPQSKPLSAGEVLGCTAPKIGTVANANETVAVFVADGRFHLEAFMIANPGIKAFRYDPYLGKLFLEEYDHKGMRETRRRAIQKAKRAKSWGIVLGTLGRQGNPRVLERLEGKMREKGFDYTIILMSEISPTRIALFEDAVDAWIQIACPRLSIDWGDAFVKPLLTTFEAEIALGEISGWWERDGCGNGLSCGESKSCCGCRGREDFRGDYPMDYYAQDGGEWNSSYVKKLARPVRRNIVPPSGNGAVL